MKIKNIFHLTNDEVVFYYTQRIMTLRAVEKKKLNLIPAAENLNNKIFNNIQEYEDKRNANFLAAAYNSRLTAKKKRITEKISHYQKLLNDVLPPYVWIRTKIKGITYCVGRDTNDWHSNLGTLHIKLDETDLDEILLPELKHITIN